MNRVVTLVCLVVGAAAMSAPRVARAQPKPTVAVLGLEIKDDGSGIDERTANVARILTDQLRSRAGSGGPYKIAPGSEKELVDALLFANCTSSSDLGCMVRIGNDMATDYLIYGNLKKDGKNYQVTLTLLDVNSKKIVRTMTEPIEGGKVGQVALASTAKTLYARIAGQSSKGSLVITANVDSGNIYIDNQVKGQLVKKQGRVAGLEAGRYRLGVESEGYKRLDKVITITGGQDTEEDIKLEKGEGVKVEPPPPDCVGPSCPDNPPKPAGRSGGTWRKVFWGSVVLVGAAGGTWLYTGYQYKWGIDSEPFMGRAVSESDCGNDLAGYGDQSDLDKRCSYRKISLVAAGVAVGGAIVAGVSYYLGYHRTRGEKRPPGVVRRGKRSKNNTFVVTPVVRPDGGGATFRIDW